MEQKVIKKIYKLVNTVKVLQAQNKFLKYKNNNLQSTIIKEKKQYTYNKGLFEKMHNKQKNKALIFSLNKIK